MIDLNHLEKYRENNRIEAKKALGGLPHSIWETYSAFANTLGGIILLGVEEHKDKTLHPVDLPDPEGLIREFWAQLNDPRKASANVLTRRDVRVEEVDGDHIVVIEVPRAQRYLKPVYVDGNPATGAYRRSGEGDYHCTAEELRAMYRDADMQTQDMLVLDSMDGSVFCTESVRAYRKRMRRARPNHVWEALDDGDFLMKLGASATGEDGKAHPTAAGLLMFGREAEILREYPRYALEYREEGGEAQSRAERVISSSGGWSGNVFDFYVRVCGWLHLDRATPDGAQGDAAVRKAVREALANCLINADYYGSEGVVIVKQRDRILLSNPGEFRVALSEAKSGGRSDPRNGVMMKMFNLIGIGERAGSGIPSILYIWKQRGWSDPVITQRVNPNRIELSLPLTQDADQNAAADGDSGAPGRTAVQKELVIAYLTDHASATGSELGALLGLPPAQVETLLRELAAENIVAAAGEGAESTYRLKA